MLYRGVASYNTSKTALTRLKSSRERYYKSKVFPSQDNVKIVKENTKQIDAWFNKLITKLSAGNVISNDRSPSHFITMGNRVRLGLVKKARLAGTELPGEKKNFAFGFERYTGADRDLPKPEDIPRLMEQLAIINGISTILFNNGIKSLSLVKRDVFESTVADAPDDSVVQANRSRSRRSRSRRRSSSVSQSHSTNKAEVGLLTGDKFYAKMHFVFEFRAKEKSFINIMNAFSKNKMFIVVTSLSINKKTQKLMPDMVVQDKEDKSKGADSIFGDGSSAGDSDIQPQRLGPDFPVCGIKMEIPMDIHLELDVYKFKEADRVSGN